VKLYLGDKYNCKNIGRIILKLILEKVGVEGAAWIEIAQQMGPNGNYSVLCERYQQTGNSTSDE